MIVTANVPAVAAWHDSVAVPDAVTLLGVIDPHVSPVGTLSVRLTLPANPLTAVIVMVEDAATPAEVLGLVAEIVKSVMVNVAVVE